MTVCELIVYNSTIPAGQGTFLEHLLNIAVAREAWCTIGIDVKDVITIDVVSDIITADLKDAQLGQLITDDVTINTDSSIIGVNI